MSDPTPTTPMISIDGLPRLLATGVATAIGYFALSKLGLAFIESTTQVAVVWIAAGFALATLLVVPQRAWPVVIAGVFAGNFVAQLTVRGNGWLSAGLAGVNALAPLLVALALLVVHRRVDWADDRPARRLAALLVAVVTANAFSSAAGAAIVAAAFDGPFGPTFVTWYFGDALGFLMVAPVTIAFRQRADPRPSTRVQIATLGVGTAVALAAFFPESFGLTSAAPLPLLVVPVLLWAALQAGLRTTSILLLIVEAIGARAVARGHLVLAPALGDDASRILAYQIFLAVLIVCTMLVSTVAADSFANERSAEQGRERVESILRALTEYAVTATDYRTGEITFVNVGAERLLGYSADEVVGKLSAFDLHVPEEVEARMIEMGVDQPGHALTLLPAQGHPETRRWTYRRKDGSRIRVILTISPERDLRGQLTGFIGVAREVTEEERQEQEIRDSLLREREIVAQLRAANEARGEFISTVSHELRTPLTNVVGFSEMLRTGDFGDLTAAQLAAVDRVEGNGRRLLTLVEDLLTMNRMDAGDLVLRDDDVDLVEVIRHAVDQVALTGERAGVSLEADLPAGAVVRGDAGRLERMLVNVIGNAVKFSTAGGAVSVSLTVGNAARIVVADTGIGIPADELDQVFERFFRARQALDRAVPGTGLGLPIARSIAEAHGGSVDVRSTVGVGTTVTIELPVRLTAEQRSSRSTLAR